MTPAMAYFVGLDLGPAGEYTALAVLERPLLRPRMAPKPAYALRHLRRYDIGTPFPEIIEDVRTLIRTPPLPGCKLVIDKTGVGQAVLKLFSEGLKHQVTCIFFPVTIVAAIAPEFVVNGRVIVAKQELVGTLQVLLQTRRLQFARELPDTAVLVRELETYRLKPLKLSGESEDLWRERPHDDLVLAVALAAWVGEKSMPEIGTAPRPLW